MEETTAVTADSALLSFTGGCTAYDVVLILKKRPRAGRGLRSDAEGGPGRHRSEGVHEDSLPLHVQRPQPEAGHGGAGDRAVARQILLGHDHAGEDRRDHAFVRDRRPKDSRRWWSSPSTCPHRHAHRQRHLGRPHRLRLRAVLDLVDAHLLDDRARLASCGGSLSRWLFRWASTWRSVSTTKPRLCGIAHARGHRAQRVGAGIPQRIQQAGLGTQLGQALGRPGQVVFLLAAGRPRTARASPGCRAWRALRVVQGLGADFARRGSRASGRRCGALPGRSVRSRGRARRVRARLALATPPTTRRARSTPAIRRSSG
jgi:hypothetical protein